MYNTIILLSILNSCPHLLLCIIVTCDKGITAKAFICSSLAGVTDFIVEMILVKDVHTSDSDGFERNKRNSDSNFQKQFGKKI